MSQRQHECRQHIFVVKQLKSNFLGLSTIKALHLLTVVDDFGDDPAGSIYQTAVP